MEGRTEDSGQWPAPDGLGWKMEVRTEMGMLYGEIAGTIDGIEGVGTPRASP